MQLCTPDSLHAEWGESARLLALTAGVAAASTIQPEHVLDYSLDKASVIITKISYGAEGNPRRNYLQSKWREYSEVVNAKSRTWEWKAKIMDFDQQSPIHSTMIVQAMVGIGAYVATRRIMRMASRSRSRGA